MNARTAIFSRLRATWRHRAACVIREMPADASPAAKAISAAVAISTARSAHRETARAALGSSIMSNDRDHIPRPSSRRAQQVRGSR